MITIHPTGQKPSILGHIGTVEDVIAATLSPEMTSRRYHASEYKMGFELATPKNIESLGEAVLVNGYCFTNSTDRSSKDYDKTIAGEEFTSGGIFLVPKQVNPTHQVQVAGPLNMIDFYEELYSQIKHPLAFGGIFHLSDFYGTAIGKAPLDGLNIFEHKEIYYPNPTVRLKDRWGFVMGAMSDFVGYSEINQQLKTVLYKNPNDTSSSLVHHAHIVLFKKKIERYEEIVPEVVDRTLHLSIDGTAILSGKVDIFLVAGLKDHLLKGKKVDEGS